MPSATIIESRDRNAPAKPLRKIIPGEPQKPSRVFVRWLVAHGLAHFKRTSAQAAAATRWPKDRLVAAVLRAPSEPPANLQDPDTVRALGQTMVIDYLDALAGLSSAARVLTAGLVLKFDHAAAISVPVFPPRIPVPLAPIEGGPIAVIEADASAALLEPRKIPVIVTATREMLESSNAEKMLGDALAVAVNAALESMLFDDQPASAARPAGLRSFNPAVIQSTAIDNGEAMLIDMGRLASATQHVAAGRPLIYVAAAARRLHMTLRSMGIPAAAYEILPTAMMADNLLLAIAPFALVSAVGAPTIEVAREATLHMDDAPQPLMAPPTRSLWQTDTVALKITLPIAWALRERGAAQWLRPQWPSDGGGPGGMPDGPHDGTTYGRRDGAWEQVAEEAPATPPATAFVRTNVSTSPWVPLDNLLVSYAPLDSPGFIGAPTAPNPPQGDASTRVATTQFVADNAGAGGVEEVPATPNGAYARVRSAAGADWIDFNTLRVASLDNPVFAIGALTNVAIGFGDNLTGLYRSGNLIAFAFNGSIPMQVMTTSVASFVPLNVPDATADGEAVNRRSGDARYLQRSGGQMAGALIAAPGSGPTNPGLGIGDNATGFYREGSALVIAALGDPHMVFNSNRTAQLMWPLSLSNNVISVLGDATADDHALNRRTADARYLQQSGGFVTGGLQLLFTPVVPNDAVTKGYVDGVASPRAPSVVIEPDAASTTALGAWVNWWTGTYPIPRGGNSRLLVSVAINIDQTGSNNGSGATGMMGVRCSEGTNITQRFAFHYKPATDSPGGGIATQFFLDVSGTLASIAIDVAAFALNHFTTTAGSAADRSQICIVDLGPR